MIPMLSGLLRLFHTFTCPTCGAEIPERRQIVQDGIRWGACPCHDAMGRPKGQPGYDVRQPQLHGLADEREVG
jgi:hypothetical protein